MADLFSQTLCQNPHLLVTPRLKLSVQNAVPSRRTRPSSAMYAEIYPFQSLTVGATTFKKPCRHRHLKARHAKGSKLRSDIYPEASLLVCTLYYRKNYFSGRANDRPPPGLWQTRHRAIPALVVKIQQLAAIYLGSTRSNLIAAWNSEVFGSTAHTVMD